MLRWADEKFSPINRATVPKPNSLAKQKDFWRVTCTDGEVNGIQCLTYRPTPAFTRAHGLPSQRLAYQYYLLQLDRLKCLNFLWFLLDTESDFWYML